MYPITSYPPVVSVIVPTYCEASNLRVLVPRISAVFDGANLRGEIIVVDDASPDDTEQVCAALSRRYPLRLLSRSNERGLSSAVLHGMRHAGGDVLIVMDADLSHPPEKLLELYQAIAENRADFVIGSRYVAGGGTEDGWGLFRWLNSRTATLLARPLTTARDPMAGFFAIRRSAVESATQLDPIGYKIGLELMVKCGCRRIEEIPITFSNRLHGASKLSLKEQLNYLRHLKRLYEFKLGHAARFCRFAVVGATGAVVDLLIFSALMSVCTLGLARAVAVWSAMTWNFVLNRKFTFSHAGGGPIVRQYVLFCASCFVGAVVNWSVTLGLHSAAAYFEPRPLLAAGCGIAMGAVCNYLLSAHFAFGVSPGRVAGRDESILHVDEITGLGRKTDGLSRRGGQPADGQQRASVTH